MSEHSDRDRLAEPTDVRAEPTDVRAEPTDELAERLRLLAAVDPELAREFVAELVVTLDRTTGGRFAAQLSPGCRAALGLGAVGSLSHRST